MSTEHNEELASLDNQNINNENINTTAKDYNYIFDSTIFGNK